MLCLELLLTLNSTPAKPGNVASNPINVIVYFAACTEKSIWANVRQNRRFSLVANDTFHNKAPVRTEKYVFRACVVKKYFLTKILAVGEKLVFVLFFSRHR